MNVRSGKDDDLPKGQASPAPEDSPPAVAESIQAEIREIATQLGVDLSDPKVASVFIQSVTRRSSPYPDIETAKQWESIYPGAARIFIDMPRDQALHRQALERTQVRVDAAIRLGGSVFAGIVALASIYAAYNLALVAKGGYDYLLVVLILIVGVGGTNIVPRIIERLPKYTIMKDKE